MAGAANAGDEAGCVCAPSEMSLRAAAALAAIAVPPSLRKSRLSMRGSYPAPCFLPPVSCFLLPAPCVLPPAPAACTRAIITDPHVEHAARSAARHAHRL